MGSKIPIEVAIATTYNAAGVKALEQSVSSFGMKLRLTGRDMLRLGTVAAGFFGSVKSQFDTLMGLSLDWSAVMSDIQYGFEDIANVLGSTLAPSLEWVSGLLEQISQFLEENPWAIYMVGAIAIVAIIGMVVSAFVKLVGFLNLFIGGVITAGTTSMRLGEALHYLFIRFTEGIEASNAYLASIHKVKTASTTLVAQYGREVKALDRKHMALLKDQGTLLTYIDSIKKSGLSEGEKAKALAKATADYNKNETAIASTEKAQKKANRMLKKATEESKKESTESEKAGKKGGVLNRLFKDRGASAKTWIGAAAGLAGAGIGIIAGWEALQPIMDDLNIAFQDIATTIVDSLMPIIDPIITFVGNLATWFSSLNPGVQAFIGFLIAALGFLVLIGALSGPISMMGTAWVFVTASMLPAIFAFGAWLLEQGIALAEIPILGSLLQVLGMSFMTVTGSVMSLVISMIALVAGFLVGYSLAQTFMGMFGPLGGAIIPIIGIIWSLVAAVLALQGVLSWGTAVPLLLAGIGMAVGGVVAAAGIKIPVPHLATGGVIAQGGMALLHSGEEVRPAQVTKKKRTEAQTPIVININAPIGSKEIAKSLTDEISKIMDKKYERGR